jgi:hypothetical protein
MNNQGWYDASMIRVTVSHFYLKDVDSSLQQNTSALLQDNVVSVQGRVTDTVLSNEPWTNVDIEWCLLGCYAEWLL